MPEGDAVRRTADRLHRALAGGTVVASDFPGCRRWPPRTCAARRCWSPPAAAKHLLLRVSGSVAVHTHLRMDASWRLSRIGGPRGGGPEWQVRLVLTTVDWHAVGYRLPVVTVLPTREDSRVAGHLGPDLLRPAAGRRPRHSAGWPTPAGRCDWCGG